MSSDNNKQNLKDSSEIEIGETTFGCVATLVAAIIGTFGGWICYSLLTPLFCSFYPGFECKVEFVLLVFPIGPLMGVVVWLMVRNSSLNIGFLTIMMFLGTVVGSYLLGLVLFSYASEYSLFTTGITYLSFVLIPFAIITISSWKETKNKN